LRSAARSLGVGGAASDRFLDISPDDIESVEIVKGPAAATLYGTEAAAGVVRVTTKRGNAARSQTTLVLDGGQRWDANQYPDRAWNPLINLGAGYKDTTYYINSLKGGADMPNERSYYDPFRKKCHKLSLGSRGGTGTFGYYMGYNLSSQEGVFSTNDQKAHNLRSNLNFEPFKNARINLSSGFTTSNTAFNYGDGESWGFVGAALLGPPMWAPINAADPTSGGAKMLTCPRALGRGPQVSRRWPAPRRPASTTGPSRANNYDRLSTMDAAAAGAPTGSATGIHHRRLVVHADGGYDSYTERGFNMVPNIPLKIVDSDRTARPTLSRSLTLRIVDATYQLRCAYRRRPSVRSGTRLEQRHREQHRLPAGTGTLGNGRSATPASSSPTCAPSAITSRSNLAGATGCSSPPPCASIATARSGRTSAPLPIRRSARRGSSTRNRGSRAGQSMNSACVVHSGHRVSSQVLSMHSPC
jgi:TonB-dependent SusC/RagA subfamily outer membrane receptor